MIEILIYAFFILAFITFVFVYSEETARKVGTETIKDTTTDIVDPVVRNFDESTDGYLCSFLNMNDKVLYRMEKNYSRPNREYTLHNQWLVRTSIAICILLMAAIFIFYDYSKLSLATIALNFGVVTIAVLIVFVAVFLDPLRQYDPVESNYVMRAVKRDLLNEMNQ